MPQLLRDLRYAWRGLVRSPVFTLVALLSIALGIGANTAIFTLVDRVLLRRLPVPNPDELVLFTQLGSHYGNNNGSNASSFPMYEDFREAFVDPAVSPALPRVSLPYDVRSSGPLFSGVFCRFGLAMNIGFNGNTERVPGEIVSGTYFSVLGVGAAIGRVISPEDDMVRAGHPVAVLSHEYWRNRFGADPGVIGQSITVNGHPFTIIGVSAAGFDGIDIGNAPSVRVPMMMAPVVRPGVDELGNRRTRWVNVFARLEPETTAEQAKAALQPYFRSLRENETREPAFRNASAFTREEFLKGTIDLLPAAQGRSAIRNQLRQPLWLLMGIVAGVLLIACANVASLLIARAASRQKEMAVRLAIGAGRGRIVRQLLAESLLLSMLGGALGLLVASWTAGFLLGFLPTSETPHVISASLDGRVLAFAFVLTLVTGLLFGLIPALRATKPSIAPTLKDQAGAVVGGGVRIRKGLVIAQVTLSVLLLVGAGLFIRSLRNLHQIDLGIRPESLVAFNVSPAISGYPAVKAKQFYQQVADRLQAQGGVESVAFALMGLLDGSQWDSTITIEGYAAKPGENMSPYCNAVSPGYFKTVGIPLVLGRDFDERDAVWSEVPIDPDKPPPYSVAIVNESFVKHYFGGANPIGRHIGFGNDVGTPTPIEIIGVVKDAKYTGVRAEVPRQVFFAFLQNNFAGSASVYVRSAQDPAAAFGAARRTVQALDAGIPLYNLRTLERQIERSLLNERLIATLATAFSMLATLLAVIGLYGVMAYTVARRTREIGVRMALGAVSGDVMWLVMREVVLLVGCGIVLGLVGAWSLSRLVSSQLYGITPNDPVTVAGAALSLALVALLAGYLPARRATRVNPVRALRYE
jgi:predicted permease